MSIPIGKMRHRLTLQQEMRMGDGGGGSQSAWQDVAEIWGALEGMSGGEAIMADRISGNTKYQITIRWRSDVSPAMRFLFGGRIFQILTVLDADGRRRFLRCACEERDL